MSLPDDLRRLAHHLATREPRRPTQASLRRAVSTAYYGLFHLLIDEATAMMFGRKVEHRAFRYLLARAFSHQSMVLVCKSFQQGKLPDKVTATVGTLGIPSDLQDVAATFVRLQQERHRADYNLAEPFQKADVLLLLQETDQAFQAWKRVRSDKSARLFLMVLPLWKELQR